MLKKALVLVAIAMSLPTQAAEPQTVVLAWTLMHNGKEVDLPLPNRTPTPR